MASKVRVKVKLVSTGVDENGKKSSYYYTTYTNPRNNDRKLEMKKYDPILGKHVMFKEEKIKK